jgi:glycine/D-amino acid oxidase-like deaminating enzyme
MWPFRRHSSFGIRSSQAYWLLRNGVGDAVRTVDSSLDCDIVIVGSGITGALVADALVETGQRIVMLDRHEPAQGSTAASTALLQYEIDTHLVELTRLRGAEAAVLAYRACVEAIPMLERRFPELLAQSGFERRESVYLAADESAVEPLRVELSARRAIGIHAEWLETGDLQRRHGCLRPGAIVSSLAAVVDPVRFTRGVLAGCARHGVAQYGRARVEKLEEAGDRLALRLESGHTVRAAQVVIACGYESLSFLGHDVADIDNTFALVTEPLADRGYAAGLPQIWESARPYIYLRGTPDGRLMLGGADLPFKNAAAREILLPRQLRRLAAAYEKLFGRVLPPVAWGWAGSFATTRDGLPFIGAVPGGDPRVHYALCFGGNGITYAAHAGDIIRAGIEGRVHSLAGVFGFGRLGAELGGERLDERRAL